MANTEHVAALRDLGVAIWNNWRKAHQDLEPDLSGADLRGANLSGADLVEADLSRADLNGADLSRADLSGANLIEAYLVEADLSGAALSRVASQGFMGGAAARRRMMVVMGAHAVVATALRREGCSFSMLVWFILAEGMLLCVASSCCVSLRLSRPAYSDRIAFR